MATLRNWKAERRLKELRADAEACETCVDCGGPLGRPRGLDPVCFACQRYEVTELVVRDMEYLLPELDAIDAHALAEGEAVRTNPWDGFCME